MKIYLKCCFMQSSLFSLFKKRYIFNLQGCVLILLSTIYFPSLPLYLKSVVDNSQACQSLTTNNCLRIRNFYKCWFQLKTPCNGPIWRNGGGGEGRKKGVGKKKEKKNLRTSSDEFLIFLPNKEMSVIQRNSLKWYYKIEYGVHCSEWLFAFNVRLKNCQCLFWLDEKFFFFCSWSKNWGEKHATCIWIWYELAVMCWR